MNLTMYSIFSFCYLNTDSSSVLYEAVHCSIEANAHSLIVVFVKIPISTSMKPRLKSSGFV